MCVCVCVPAREPHLSVCLSHYVNKQTLILSLGCYRRFSNEADIVTTRQYKLNCS